MVKNPSANAGSIPSLGRSSGGGNGNPLQHSCLKNAMDRGGWRAIVHGVAKSRTRLSTEYDFQSPSGSDLAFTVKCNSYTREKTGWVYISALPFLVAV